MGAGLSQNVGQRFVCRGLVGLFGSAPLVCSAAAMVDLWSLVERNYAFPFFSIVSFLGAVVAPFPGSVITWVQAVSWRWVDWVTIIFCRLPLTLAFFFLPESYSPIILYWKANQLRRLTNDDRYRAPLEFKTTTFTKRIR
jgi:MFS family permease